jgi:hypothetical protein
VQPLPNLRFLLRRGAPPPSWGGPTCSPRGTAAGGAAVAGRRAGVLARLLRYSATTRSREAAGMGAPPGLHAQTRGPQTPQPPSSAVADLRHASEAGPLKPSRRAPPHPLNRRASEPDLSGPPPGTVPLAPGPADGVKKLRGRRPAPGPRSGRPATGEKRRRAGKHGTRAGPAVEPARAGPDTPAGRAGTRRGSVRTPHGTDTRGAVGRATAHRQQRRRSRHLRGQGGRQGRSPSRGGQPARRLFNLRAHLLPSSAAGRLSRPSKRATLLA